MGSRRRHDGTLLRIQRWVRRVRRIIGALGWLARLQWFVKNVAPVSALEGEPSVPPGVSIRPGSPDDAMALAPLIHGRESLGWRFTRAGVPQRASWDLPLALFSCASARSFRTLSASGPSGTTFRKASAALTAAGKSRLPWKRYCVRSQ